MAERKKYDMQQALAMKGKVAPKNRKERARAEGGGKVSAAAGSSSEVNEALQRLDRAEDLAARGRLEEASALYQDAIANLIKSMNDIKISNTATSTNTGTPSLLNLEVLKERTKVALTDAELIKEKIKIRETETPKVTVKPQGEKVKKAESKGMLGLLRGKSKSEKAVVKKKDSVPIPTLQISKSVDDKILATNSKVIKQKTKPKPTQRSNLNYKTNDPFIETVKKDMYIDSKSLNISWNDISGLKTPKQSLQEAAILPLLRPDLYTGLRAAPRGILLYGPPGTGKTMLVKAVAHESQCILFACSASSMTSKWVGEGEKLVRTLFRMAADVAPSIIFLDEIDALLGRRKSDNTEQESSRRFKTEFMVQMDGIAAGGGDSENKTLLIGCTNCPWDIDDAIMRRFQRRIYVPLPDRAARQTLWTKLLSKSKGSVKLKPKDVEKLVGLSQGFSCSDISSIASEAAFGPLREFGIDEIKDLSLNDIRPIQMKDFEDAAENTKKSVSTGLLKRYNEWEGDQANIN